MSHGNRKSQLSQMALQFQQRRYDGGPEIDIIHRIEEYQTQNYALGRVLARAMAQDLSSNLPQKKREADDPQRRPKKAVSQHPNPESSSSNLSSNPSKAVLNQAKIDAARERQASQQQKATTQAVLKPSWQQLLASGPLLMLVGALGMGTSVIAKLTLFRQANPVLQAQCQRVWNESRAAMNEGFAYTLQVPGRFVHQVVFRK